MLFGAYTYVLLMLTHKRMAKTITCSLHANNSGPTLAVCAAWTNPAVVSKQAPTRLASPLTAGRPGRAVKFWWFLTFMYGTLVYCTLFGLMVVAISPNLMIAAVVSAAFYSMWNLFAGFILPRPVRPPRSSSSPCFVYGCDLAA